MMEETRYLKFGGYLVTNPITNESSVASLDAQEGMNVQNGMWTHQQLAGLVVTPHIVSPQTEGVSMNYNSGNQQQVYNFPNANIIQMQTVPQGQNLFNLMPPDAGVACVKRSQPFHYVSQAIEQNMDNSVSASESMGSTQVSGTGSRSFSYITHGSEQEVDGMPQNIYPQQETGWTKSLWGELFSQPSADKIEKKDILEEAAQELDLAVFDNELLPLDYIIDENSDNIGGEVPVITTPENLHDVNLFSPVTKDDSNLSVDIPGSPSAKKGKKCKRKPTKEVDGPSKSKKPRLWEIQKPFENKELEKKRLDAIRARRNRIRNRDGKLTLAEELKAVAKERDALKEQVAKLAAQRKALELAVKERYAPTVKTIAGHEQGKVIYIPYQTPLTLPSDISLPLSSPE